MIIYEGLEKELTDTCLDGQFELNNERFYA